MDTRLAFLANRLDVDLTPPRAMATHACLHRRQNGPPSLTVSTSVPWPSRLPAQAMLLQVEALAWPGRHFRFRYPLPDDAYVDRRRASHYRRDYRTPYRLGLRVLMPDAMLAEFERDELDPRHAAELAGVTVADLEDRVRDWRGAPAGRKVAAIEELRARGAIMKGSEVKGPPTPPIPSPTPPPPTPIPSPPIKRRPPGRATENHIRWAAIMKQAREEGDG